MPPFELNSDKWTPLTTQDSADNFCSTTRPPSKAVTPCAQSQSIHSYLSLRSKLNPFPPKSNFWSNKETNSISSFTTFFRPNSVKNIFYPVLSVCLLGTHILAEHCNVTTIFGRRVKKDIQVLRSIYYNVSRIKRVF